MFTATHQALLVGWIHREVILRFGEENGVRVLLEANRRYAFQRGKRMAMRVARDGRKLTGINYLCYGEWTSDKGALDIKIIDRTPRLVAHAVKCPWDTAWRQHGLVEYGKYFCQAVDAALYQGYNPALKLDVNGTRTNGCSHCEFVYHDINLNIKNMLICVLRKKLLAKKVVMPWEYHTGHAFKTMGESVISAFGEKGEEVMTKVLEEFKEHFGDKAAAIVKQHLQTDFDVLPD